MRQGHSTRSPSTTSSTAPSAPASARKPKPTCRGSRARSSWSPSPPRTARSSFWDGTELKQAHRLRLHRPRSLPCRAAEIERELRRSVGAEITEKDLKNTIILNAKVAHRKGRRLREIRRPHPALLHLRGSPRLEHHAATASTSSRKPTARRLQDPTSSTASPSNASAPSCSKLRPRQTRRRPRPHRRPRLRLPRHPDALRSLPHRRQNRPASRAASRRRSSSGCASPWASSSKRKPTAKTGSSASTTSTKAAASARPRPRSSTPAPSTASSRPATSTRWTTPSSPS